MSFEFKKVDDSTCVFEARPGGDDATTFLHCVQTALKQLQLNITVDVSQNPMALGSVLPHLLKLQQVLGSHGKSAAVIGLKRQVPQDFITRLQALGIRLLDVEGGIAPQVGLAQSVMSAVADAPKGPPLPSGDEVESRFKELKTQMAEALKLKRYLTSEKKTYVERQKDLKIAAKHGVDEKKLHDIQKFENELIKLRDERAHVVKVLEEAEKKKVAADAENKKVTQEVQNQYKEKKKVIDKKLDDLMKVRDKFQADFKKKQDTRKAQLAQANKAKPAGT